MSTLAGNYLNGMIGVVGFRWFVCVQCVLVYVDTVMAGVLEI